MKVGSIKNYSGINVESRQSLGLKSGDTVKVHVKIVEKNKSRIQIFEGLVLVVKHGLEPGATFTVRKTSRGFGVERIFPLYSPLIDKIEIIKRSRVRRAKLYNIREKVQKDIKRQIKRKLNFTSETVSESQEAKRKIELEKKQEVKLEKEGEDSIKE